MNPIDIEDIEDPTRSFVQPLDRSNSSSSIDRLNDDLSDEVYHPVLRFLMALCGAPFALNSVLMILISPIMIVFMGDDPSSMKFPGMLTVLFLFLAYLGFATLLGFYSWLLESSAWLGHTAVCGRKFSSSVGGTLMLIPSMVLLIPYYRVGIHASVFPVAYIIPGWDSGGKFVFCVHLLKILKLKLAATSAPDSYSIV